jgi:threonine dehydratase
MNLTRRSFEDARERVGAHAYHTPLMTSRLLSQLTGCDVRLKAEMFQRTGSYKIRGPLNKFPQLSAEQKARGVICSSAGNHAQGVAQAAAIHGIKAVVVMAENATPSKIEAKELVRDRGYTYIHPFDDEQLVAGQGTLGLEIVEDWPEVDAVVVPIGGGGLISGVAVALKTSKPDVRLIGVESSGAPAMKQSVESGRLVTLDRIDCIIDGLKVMRVGELNFEIVSRYVDELVALPDEQIFDALVWIMSRCKLVVEGAAAAPVAALLGGLVKLRPGSKVVCVLSGGNVDLSQLKGRRWN